MSEVTTYGTAEPVRLPRRMSYEAEFLRLMDQRRQIDTRLDQLVELIEPGVPHLPTATLLPKSKLRLVSNKPGSLPFKGGCND